MSCSVVILGFTCVVPMKGIDVRSLNSMFIFSTGLQNYIVFANGRPVIGEDNEPVCVPAGSKLMYPNIDRTVTNTAGTLVMGMFLLHSQPICPIRQPVAFAV